MNFPKHPPYRNKRYREFVRTLPCSVESDECKGQTIPHHVVSVGAGGSDLTCIPLCVAHHAEIHSQGRGTFAEKHGVCLRRLQAETLTAWVEMNDPSEK